MHLRERLSEYESALDVARDFGMVVVYPALVPYFIFHAAVRWLPLWGQVLVVAALAFVLLAAFRFFFGASFERSLRSHHAVRLMVWFPLAAALGTVVFAMQVFSAAHSVLITAGLASVTPPIAPTDWSRLSDFYLWHLFAAVPAFKIPETLKWPVPFQYSDSATGALILAFQFAVIAPISKVFYTWFRVRGEFKIVGTKPDA